MQDLKEFYDLVITIKEQAKKVTTKLGYDKIFEAVEDTYKALETSTAELTSRFIPSTKMDCLLPRLIKFLVGAEELLQ